MIKKIKDIIPIGYLLIVILGYYTKSTYYQYFDIEIFNYLDITEFLFPAFLLGNVLIVAFSVLISMILVNILVIGVEKIDEELEVNSARKPNKLHRLFSVKIIWNKINDIKNNTSKSFFEIIKLYLYYFIIFFDGLLYIYLYTWPLIIVVSNSGIFFFSFHLAVTLLLTFFWAFILYLKVSKNELKDTTNKFGLIRICILFLLMIPIIWTVNKYNARITLKGISTKDVIINKGREIIKTNDHRIFIGQTRNYIFFRDIKKDQTIIVNLSDIDKMKTFNAKIN